jgi:hypothetical protein
MSAEVDEALEGDEEKKTKNAGAFPESVSQYPTNTSSPLAGKHTEQISDDTGNQGGKSANRTEVGQFVPVGSVEPTAKNYGDADPNAKQDNKDHQKGRGRRKGVTHSPEGDSVCKAWAEEMRLARPGFVVGNPSSEARGIGHNLWTRFPDSGETAGVLRQMIRLAIWDWDALRVTHKWYVDGKPIPTLREISYLADTLAAFVKTGITTTTGSHRVSAYAAKWLTPAIPAAELDDDPLLARAKREGKTLAEVARDIADEQREAKRVELAKQKG